MRHIGGPYRHLVALLDAQGHQPFCYPVDGGPELAPRLPIVSVGIYDRFVVRIFCHRLVQKLTERCLPGDLFPYHFDHLERSIDQSVYRRGADSRRAHMVRDDGVVVHGIPRSEDMRILPIDQFHLPGDDDDELLTLMG